MVYRGQVCGDVIVLSDGVHLPEGLEVLVQPVGVEAGNAPPIEVKLRNGIAVFDSTGMGPAPDLELVNELRDDDL